MNSSRLKVLLIAMGPTIAVIIWTFFDLVPGNRSVTWMAGIAGWMAWWWLTEAVHFALTATIPLIALPALGIAGIQDTLLEYADRIIFVFAGGFAIALALEKWNLHRRFALLILSKSVASPSGVVVGILLTTYLLSMWISNTATVLMLLPAVLAIAKETTDFFTEEKQKKKFMAAVLLALGYAATIGGMATLVGTPTNMIFYAKMVEEFGEHSGVTFGSWFLFAGPLSFLLLLVCYLILWFFFLRKLGKVSINKRQFSNDYASLGKWSRDEKAVGTVFLITALGWFTRSDLTISGITLEGWGGLIPEKFKFFRHDFLPAVVMALSLFLIPASKGFLLVPKDILKIPFEIILLFGGGFAMAMGIEESGMSTWMASALTGFSSADPILFVAAMALLICIISEFASNVACIQLMIPILMAFYPQLGVSALFLLVPATLAASLGFMLPVATAPNTIVFGTKKIRTAEMLKVGLFLDIAGILLITLFVWLLGDTLLPFNK